MNNTVYGKLFDSLSEELKNHSVRTGKLSEMLSAVFIKELSESYIDISRDEILKNQKLCSII